jgi:glutaredoxin
MNSPEARPMTHKPHVVFYTKPGCHLCAEARIEIARAGLRDLYTFEEINILSDPDLQRRYGHDIPVVVINGAHAFKHRLTAEDFKKRIEQSRGR